MKYRKIDAHEHAYLYSGGPEVQVDNADRLGIERLIISRPVITQTATPDDFRNANDHSISVSCPSNAHWARRAVLETGGLSLLVSDEEILAAQQRLAATTGIFAEPAAATAAAGLLKLQAGEGRLAPGAEVVVLATGHGLKDVDAPLSRISIPAPIDPVLEAVKL